MNPFSFYHLHPDRHLVQILLLLVVQILLVQAKPILCNPSASLQQTHITENIPFRERLSHYINTHTNEAVEEFIAREKQLLLLVNNVRKEISLRDKAVFFKNENAFSRLSFQADTLIGSYDRELVFLIKIHDDLNRLRRIADFGEDTNVQMMISDSKTRLFKMIEEGKFGAGMPLNYQRFTEMVRAYTFELDSLLNIYDQLHRLESVPKNRDDEHARTAIAKQKAMLFRALAQWGKWGPLGEQDFQRLQAEFHHIDAMFTNFDSLAFHAQDYARQVGILKRSLIDRVDRTVYDLMTTSGYSMSSSPAVSDFVKAWKEKRFLEVEVKLTEYRIILTDLINTARPEERQRMIMRDIDDALGSFAEQQYKLCEHQIQNILELYREFLLDKSPLYFYLAECRHNRAAHDAAAEMYRRALLDNDEPFFRQQSLLRLMQYSSRYDQSENFFAYYHQILDPSFKISPATISYAHFLAGKQFFEKRQFKQANAALQKISFASEHYWPAQLLQGVVYINMGESARAVRILQKLTEQKSYPWSNLQTAYLRNTALIRLGFLYYQKGEYRLAIETFDKVSQGFSEYDQALIGQAWANLRLGRFDQAVQRSYDISVKYLTSNFHYEALVLAAQCKQIMERPDEAVDAYRYVIRARGAKESSKKFHQERKLTLHHAKELDRMERETLEKRRTDLYQEIEKVRSHIDLVLRGLPKQSDTVSRLTEAYDDERREIFNNLIKLDMVITWAKKGGQEDLLPRAERQRERLMKILSTYHADHRIEDTALFMEFPLAAKEASHAYKRDNNFQIHRELEMEKLRLEQAFELISQFSTQVSSDGGTERYDLELLQEDLQRLRDRISRFRAWVIDHSSGEGQTHSDYWSSLAGFYLTDILNQKRQETGTEITENAQRLKTIQSLFKQKKAEIENRLSSFEEDIRQIQDNLIARKNQLELLERKTYFQKYYFDNKMREEQDRHQPTSSVPNP